MDIIKVKNLSKKYDDIVAVDNISFVVKEGELFAFLGINGAGKSTTINIISGSLEKDTGEVYIDNKNIDGDHIAFKSKIGIVFQNSVLDKNLSVKDNLTLRAGLYGMPKTAIEENIKKVSELFELKELLKRKIKTLSGGQRRRVDIARALIHNPKILIMDEPTTGLDPQTRSLLWDVIAKLRENGLSVFLTTHYMEEAANADYVIIIDEGKIVAKGTPLRLKQTYAHDTFSIYVDDKEALLEKLINDGYQVFKTSNGININIENTSFAKEIIKKYSAEIFDFEVLKGDMNSVFLNITGKDLRGE
ncbi:MAG: ABC transporter ATP-binding protein [Bacilli bacterium]